MLSKLDIQGMTDGQREILNLGIIMGREDAIGAFHTQLGHNGKTHYEGINCSFCKAVAFLEEKNTWQK